MDCLFHQVLVAMLTVTPVPDGAQLSEAQARPAITRTSDIKPVELKKGVSVKKTKAVALAARTSGNGPAVN